MSDPEQNLTPGLELSVQDVIRAFLLANPTPTDQELHKLATVLGYQYTEFEQLVFRMLSDELEDADDEDVDDAIENQVDLFLVALFSFKSDLTEEQVHAAADLLGLTPEALEERVYAILSELTSSGGSDD